MIPDLQASVLCDDVRQERNGKFMLIGIFDGLTLPAEQPVCPKICLMNRWCAGHGEFAQQSKIIGPDGITVVGQGKTVPIKLENDNQVATTVEVFINLVFHQEGTHWIEIHLDGSMRMRYPLHIRKVRHQKAPQG